MDDYYDWSEWKQKAIEFEQAITECKLDHSAKLKELESEYQIKISEIQDKYDASKDKILDLESKVGEAQQIAEWESKNRQEITKQNEEKTKKHEEAVFNLNCKIESLENQLIEQSKILKSQCSVEEILQSKIQLEEYINQIKEDKKNMLSESEKVIAVKDQQLSFAQSQVFEAHNQLAEEKKSYDALMKAFKMLQIETDTSKEDFIQQQRNEYIEEISNLQSKFEEAKSRFTVQVEKLTEENSRLDFSLKMKASELKNFISTSDQKVENLDKVIQQLEESLKVQEKQKLDLIESLEKQYKEKIKRLENEINDRVVKYQQNLEEVEEERTQQLNQLKEIYEADKRRLESRINEERRASKVKLEQQQEEHENQLREEQELHEEELEMLRDELRQLEDSRNEEIKLAQQELLKRDQKIQYLEQSIQDAKEMWANSQKENTENLHIQLHNYRSKELLFSDRGKIKSTFY